MISFGVFKSRYGGERRMLRVCKNNLVTVGHHFFSDAEIHFQEASYESLYLKIKATILSQ